MRFTWDAKKAAANLAKHGVDFRDAIRIFDGKTIEWPDERFLYDEERWIAVGLNEEQEIFVVYCEEGEVSRRIISARK
ncbi:MAG TPA: BrnT family toxin, partial [Micropepsaceae bacterium]|nr:BrnT family toxin [Micropepsaceae bacterium]